MAHQRCALCGREEKTTRHHLLPRTLHKRLKKRGVGPERLHETIDLCTPCHKHVHQTLSEKELAEDYATPEALFAHPEIAKWRDWLALRPAGFRPTQMTMRRAVKLRGKRR
jgi:hypothetical protein